MTGNLVRLRESPTERFPFHQSKDKLGDLCRWLRAAVACSSEAALREDIGEALESLASLGIGLEKR